MEEQWKDIIIEKNGIIYDYSGLYQVSNLGRVRSLDRVDSLGREIKGKVMNCVLHHKSGYVLAGLCKDGEKQQRFYVHRLVATAFIPNPENHPVVNHRDECKTNNCVDNLEWCTEKYNANYGTRNERVGEKKKGQKHSEEHKRKISEAMKSDKHPQARKVICLETKQVFGCTKDAEKWCGKTGVSGCCRGVTKTCGGYHWMYLDDYKRQLRMESDIKNSQLVA